jgi:hypothetical protein
MHVPIEVDEKAEKSLEKMPLDVYYKDLDFNKIYKFRRIYMMRCSHGTYELVVYKKSDLFPQGYIMLAGNNKRFTRLSTRRIIYEGALSKASWDKMISHLADNFMEVY